MHQAPPSHGAGGSLGLTFLMPTVATSIGAVLATGPAAAGPGTRTLSVPSSGMNTLPSKTATQVSPRRDQRYLSRRFCYSLSKGAGKLRKLESLWA